MNTIANLILPRGRTPPQPALVVRNDCSMTGEFNRADQRYFQLSAEWRNKDNDDLSYACVIGSKRCPTNQVLPGAVLFSRVKLGLQSAIGSAKLRHGAELTTCQRTVQREITFAFFQSFEGSARLCSSRRSS